MNDMTPVSMIADKITRLSDHAMLARLQISLWTARKTDRKLADKAAEQTRGDRRMHSHSRRIIEPKALGTIQKAASEARRYHIKNTRPWQYEGVGILQSKFYFEYIGREREYERQFNDAVAIFLRDYPDYIRQAKALLGDSFDEAEYPNPMAVARLFKFDLDFSKVVLGSDFRVPDIGPEAEAEIQRQIDERVADTMTAVMKTVWSEIAEHVGHMVERLKVYHATRSDDTRESKGGWFQDSIVDNLRELVERLPRLNITEDPTIEAMRVRLAKQLCANDADDLRTMQLTRQDVISKAEKILHEVEEFLA